MKGFCRIVILFTGVLAVILCVRPELRTGDLAEEEVRIASIPIYKPLEAPEVYAEGSEDGVTVHWSTVDGADYYTVFRKSDPGETERLAMLESGQEYVDTTVKNGREYVYIVEAGGENALNASGESEPVTAEVPLADLADLLTAAMTPVGTTLYVWGGGWNEEDTAAGETACYTGLYPEWEEYYDENKNGYSFQNGQDQWIEGERQWRFYGLDCSGFVGWSVYNALKDEADPAGYVYASGTFADHMEENGFGSAGDCTPDSRFLPGDIISIEGHVTLCLGQCEDGSVLLVHSTPNGGVQVSGAVWDDEEETEASRIAERFMEENYPDWWTYFGGEGRQRVEAEFFLTGRRFTWSESVLSDKDKLAGMSPEELLQRIKP